MRWAGHVAGMGERRSLYRILVGKPEEMSPPGKYRSRWKDNIKMNFQEVECEGTVWIELAQDREGWRAFVTA